MMGRDRHIAQLGNILGQARQLHQAVRADSPQAHFQLQIGDHRQQVGIAHALSDAVHGALHLGGSGTHRGQSIGHRATGIVVAVDAETGLRIRRAHRPHDILYLKRQRAPIGLAQINGDSARLHRGPHARKRVGGVRLIAVEEMLGIEYDLAACRGQVGHRVGNHAQILVEGRAQRAFHLGIPRLSHDGHHGCA
jgi:hypothetical protein